MLRLIPHFPSEREEEEKDRALYEMLRTIASNDGGFLNPAKDAAYGECRGLGLSWAQVGIN